VVAPSKTPRAAGDRVKTDRKDAELLARLLIAGQLTAVRVPDARMEARRELFRSHEQARGDLQRGRHRTSKMLLRRGRVWSEGSAWTQAHRRWLARQEFDQVESELVFADYLATVDAAAARKAAVAERLSRLAREEDLWPTVSRLRAFRGIDTLTALGLHLELGGDWARFARPAQLSAWLGPDPIAAPVRTVEQPGSDHQDRVALRPPAARRVVLALPPHPISRPHARGSPRRAARHGAAGFLARAAAPAPRLRPHEGARQTGQRRHRRGRSRALRVPLGSSRGRLNQADIHRPLVGASGRSGRHARHSYERQTRLCHARS
jgi:transposase